MEVPWQPSRARFSPGWFCTDSFLVIPLATRRLPQFWPHGPLGVQDTSFAVLDPPYASRTAPGKGMPLVTMLTVLWSCEPELAVGPPGLTTGSSRDLQRQVQGHQPGLPKPFTSGKVSLLAPPPLAMRSSPVSLSPWEKTRNTTTFPKSVNWL